MCAVQHKIRNSLPRESSPSQVTPIRKRVKRLVWPMNKKEFFFADNQRQRFLSVSIWNNETNVQLSCFDRNSCHQRSLNENGYISVEVRVIQLSMITSRWRSLIQIDCQEFCTQNNLHWSALFLLVSTIWILRCLLSSN